MIGGSKARERFGHPQYTENAGDSVIPIVLYFFDDYSDVRRSRLYFIIVVLGMHMRHYTDAGGGGGGGGDRGDSCCESL